MTDGADRAQGGGGAGPGIELAMELLLRSGQRLRLSGRVDVDLVARLVAALERC